MSYDKKFKNDLYSIQLMRNMALLMVILGHAGCIYTGTWDCTVVNKNSEIIKYFTEYIYSFHMPLFVFISGYIYNYNRKKLNKYNSVKDFMKNKFKRLIIPYIVTGIFFMIPIQKIFRVYSDNESFIYKVVNGILLGRSPAHLWYLLMMFNLFIIFRLIEKYLGNKYKLNIIIMSLISVGSIVLPNFYRIQQSLSYLIYFYIGYIFSENIESIRFKLKLGKVQYLLLHLFIFNFSYFVINKITVDLIYIKVFKLILSQITAILAVGGIFGILLCLSNNSKIIKLINNRIYFNVNKYNFSIYLLHQPIMLSIISIVRYVNIKPIFLYLLLFILTLCISIEISKLIERLNIYLKYSQKNSQVVS